MTVGIRAQAASIKDVLEDGDLTVYDGAAPDTAVGLYAVIHPGRRFGGQARLGRSARAHGIRVPVLVVGRTVNEARWVEEKVTAALSGVRVVVSGVLCTPAMFESSRPVERDPDDPKVWSGTTVWTYVAVPTT